MRNYILYNPLAGHGKTDDKLSELKSKLEGEIVVVNMPETESYSQLLAELESDDKIVICGGDGTLNRFVNAVDVDKITNDILYFASGSGNDFLNDVGADPEGNPQKINQYLTGLPTVTVNGNTYRFLNGIGFGIDGFCCEEGDKLKAKSPKPVNYTAIAIKGLLYAFKAKNAVATVDGKQYEFKKVWIAPTMNGRCYGGGMFPTPDQNRLGDGSVSFMCLHGSGKLKTLMVFPSIFEGKHISHTEMVTIVKGYDVHVKFNEPCALQIDGETVLNVTEYTVHANRK